MSLHPKKLFNSIISMAPPPPKPLLSILILFVLPLLSTSIETTSPPSPANNTTNLSSLCSRTPYPETCLHSLKLSISININPNNIIAILLRTLDSAISDAQRLTPLLLRTAPDILEKQRGTMQDCRDLHQITISALHRSASKLRANSDYRKLADARAYISAALTNKNTCLEGLDSASGPSMTALTDSIESAYRHVSNSLSLLPRKPPPPRKTTVRGRGLLEWLPPRWMSRSARRVLLQSDDDGGEEGGDGMILTVAVDGSGNFTSIREAIEFSPDNSEYRTIVVVRAGVYAENVEIPRNKPNIVLIGDGADVTIITGNRSVGDGWTTFRSATLAVSGDGFLARDITIQNTAGPEKHQAVALRMNADLVAMYRCAISGYQDTLYAHSFRQFYRECDISGTVDFIFGNAAAVFQACDIITRRPLPGQFTVVTAQSRDSPDQDTGISIHNCSIIPADDMIVDFHHNSSDTGKAVRSYLGRPWRAYSRTVVMESWIDGFVDPAGWTQWSAAEDDRKASETLYYAEFDNYGPGSGTDSRVAWPGFHVMDYDEAYNFTVSYFITGDEWLGSTSFPYEDGI
ncbi:unnamed protein product [Linum tenue]|uniref:Pectinesterase n=1 Tax=Linum tenue TaxID=586396 RepID=A0AAV0IY83_9ROSI|nr:unnamed protein product [Linum tenue]